MLNVLIFIVTTSTFADLGAPRGVLPSTDMENIGGSKEAPPGVRILSFSCSFWQKVEKIIPLWELEPPQENPGSANGKLSLTEPLGCHEDILWVAVGDRSITPSAS